MTPRKWILLSVAAGSLAGIAGAVAGSIAYIKHLRNTASISAREAFDPYYAIVQYLRSFDNISPEPDGS